MSINLIQLTSLRLLKSASARSVDGRVTRLRRLVKRLMQQYGTEGKAYRALYKARWPHGFRCPACGDRRRSHFRRGRQVYYQCCVCRHQTTPLSGTIPWGLPWVVLVAVNRWMASSQARSGSLVASKTTHGSPQGTRRRGVSSTRSCRRWPNARRRASCRVTCRSTTHGSPQGTHAIRQGKHDQRKSPFGTRACIWRKRPTDSTADLICARYCRDWRGR